MNAQALLEEYGLHLPELDEERAREAEASWQEHRDAELYEEWCESDGRIELEGDMGPEVGDLVPRDTSAQTARARRGELGITRPYQPVLVIRPVLQQGPWNYKSHEPEKTGP